MNCLIGQKSLSNLDVSKQVSVFNETIINIFDDFIPHEIITYNDIFDVFIPHKTITCDNKDPLWMKKQIKTLITKKKRSL